MLIWFLCLCCDEMRDVWRSTGDRAVEHRGMTSGGRRRRFLFRSRVALLFSCRRDIDLGIFSGSNDIVFLICCRSATTVEIAVIVVHDFIIRKWKISTKASIVWFWRREIFQVQQAWRFCSEEPIDFTRRDLKIARDLVRSDLRLKRQNHSVVDSKRFRKRRCDGGNGFALEGGARNSRRGNR